MADNVDSQASLYVVATPIGNLGDFSKRAEEVLRRVYVIAAEDTRHSARLLKNFAINTPMLSCHDFSSQDRQDNIVAKLKQGLSVALISDAGTPTIADPGYELVNLARDAGIPVVPVPGPSSVIAALSVSGMPSDRFCFEGFLPAKPLAREKALESMSLSSTTTIFLESPHRIVASMESMLEVIGPERMLFVARELTKRFEQTVKGSILECVNWIRSDANRQKGEFVLILEGVDKHARKSHAEDEGRRVLEILLPSLSVNDAVKLAVKITGASRNSLYQVAIAMSKDG